MPTSKVDIPERLLRQGRAIDPSFAPDEKLYLRLSPELKADKGLPASAMAISFPDSSVNRAKHSKPEDVILHWPDFGIAAFRVGDVPSPVSGSGIAYDFKVEHDPCECNFSHSEIRTYKDGKRPKRVTNQIVKKKFRQLLSEKTKILREPVTR